jgi:hypothetical protein
VHSRESTFFPDVLHFCSANYRNRDTAANSETSDRRTSSYRTRGSFVRATRTGRHWLEYELDKCQRNAETWDKIHTETIHTQEIQTTSQERWLTRLGKNQLRSQRGGRKQERLRTLKACSYILFPQFIQALNCQYALQQQDDKSTMKMEGRDESSLKSVVLSTQSTGKTIQCR